LARCSLLQQVTCASSLSLFTVHCRLRSELLTAEAALAKQKFGSPVRATGEFLAFSIMLSTVSEL
jgi:hypothetical protein